MAYLKCVECSKEYLSGVVAECPKCVSSKFIKLSNQAPDGLLFCPDCDLLVAPGVMNCPKCGQHRSYLIVAEVSDVKGDDGADGFGREGGLRVSTVTFDGKDFPITTGDRLPGRDLSSVVGVIFSSSSRRMGLTTTNVASNAFKDAFQDMQVKAQRMGADGVVSLLVSIERAGPSAIAFTQTVALTGTAVKFKK